MSSSPTLAELPFGAPTDADGRLTADVHCLQCGYNLRSLGLDGACPECGTAVAPSARGDLLQFADPWWLGSLASGLKWMLVSIIVGTLVGVLTPLLLFVVTFSSPVVDYFAWIGVAPVIVEAMMLLGIWKFTVSDPRVRDSDRSPQSPRIARIAEAAGVLISIIGVVMSVMGIALGIWTMQALQILGQLTGAIATMALMAWLFWLAARLPQRSMMRQARIVGWGVAVSAVLMTILGTGQMIYWQMQQPGHPGPSAAVQAPPAFTVPPPTQAAQITSTTLADGTRRTTYPANDPGSPNPSGVTTVDSQPNGSTRQYTVMPMGGGQTMTIDQYSGPAGMVITTTTTDASGSVISQNTTTSSGWRFAMSPAIIAFQVAAMAVVVGYAVFYIWAFVLLVWFYRRLQTARSAAVEALV